MLEYSFFDVLMLFFCAFFCQFPIITKKSFLPQKAGFLPPETTLTRSETQSNRIETTQSKVK